MYVCCHCTIHVNCYVTVTFIIIYLATVLCGHFAVILAAKGGFI